MRGFYFTETGSTAGTRPSGCVVLCDDIRCDTEKQDGALMCRRPYLQPWRGFYKKAAQGKGKAEQLWVRFLSRQKLTPGFFSCPDSGFALRLLQMQPSSPKWQFFVVVVLFFFPPCGYFSLSGEGLFPAVKVVRREP